MSGEQYNSSSEILGHRRISILFVILFRVKETPHRKDSSDKSHDFDHSSKISLFYSRGWGYLTEVWSIFRNRPQTWSHRFFPIFRFFTQKFPYFSTFWFFMATCRSPDYQVSRKGSLFSEHETVSEIRRDKSATTRAFSTICTEKFPQ